MKFREANKLHFYFIAHHIQFSAVEDNITLLTQHSNATGRGNKFEDKFIEN